MFRTEGGDEHFLRKVNPAFQDEIARHGHLVKLVQDGLGLLVGDAGDAGDFMPDGLHLMLVQLAQDFRAGLISQDDHQDRGFADAGYALGSLDVLNHGVSASLRSSLVLRFAHRWYFASLIVGTSLRSSRILRHGPWK